VCEYIHCIGLRRGRKSSELRELSAFSRVDANRSLLIYASYIRCGTNMFRYLENKSTQNSSFIYIYMYIVYCCGNVESKKRVSALYYTRIHVHSPYLHDIHRTADLICVYFRGLFCTRYEQFSYSNVLYSLNTTL